MGYTLGGGPNRNVRVRRRIKTSWRWLAGMQLPRGRPSPGPRTPVFTLWGVAVTITPLETNEPMASWVVPTILSVMRTSSPGATETVALLRPESVGAGFVRSGPGVPALPTISKRGFGMFAIKMYCARSTSLQPFASGLL